MIEKRNTDYGADGSADLLTRYIYSNHLQSATLELDQSAAIISYEEYHPYGTTAYETKSATINAVAKRYKYTGKERDEESGLYYHGARYYVPWLCRWTAVDPINIEWYNQIRGNKDRSAKRNYLSLAASPYEYCYDNPINYTDKGGEQATSASPVDSVNSTQKMQYLNNVDIHTKPSFWQKAGAFLRGAAKAAAIAIVAVAVVGALVASGGTLAIVAASAISAVAVGSTAVTIAEVVKGKDVFTGRKLGTLERWEMGGNLAGGGVGGLFAPKSGGVPKWTSTTSEPIPFEGAYPESVNVPKYNSTATSELTTQYSRTSTNSLNVIEPTKPKINYSEMFGGRVAVYLNNSEAGIIDINQMVL